MDNLSQTDVVLSKCHFILHNFRGDAWWNLWLSGDTGTLTVNKMALSIEVSAEMVSYSYFHWKKYDCNWVTKHRSRYYCKMSPIRPKLMSCHWSFDLRWVKISGHREQLGPCGSTSHFVNNRHSRVKTQGNFHSDLLHYPPSSFLCLISISSASRVPVLELSIHRLQGHDSPQAKVIKKVLQALEFPDYKVSVGVGTTHQPWRRTIKPLI